MVSVVILDDLNYLFEKLLGMRSYINNTSATHMLLNELPVFAVPANAFQEQLVLLFGPTSHS